MKIGLSTSVAQRGKTGIAQYLFGLLLAFREHTESHRFVLFVLEEDLPLFQFVADCMQIVPVPERFRPPLRDILWHQRVLPRLAGNYKLDAIHVPSYRRLMANAPCPRVATIHDLAPFRVTGKYDPARMLYGKLVVKRLARRQDEIITVSENTGKDLQNFFGVSPTSITVIHNGLDHERFFPGDRPGAKARVSEKHKLQKPFFLYIARLEHPAKNHVRLVHAFEQFKRQTNSEWELVFAGSDWHGADAIHAAIKASPFNSSIRSLGFVPDAALPDLYRAADSFVYPSLYEGFGLPPVEAMACGTPVISSNRGSLGEVVGSAAMIVEPEDTDAISLALRRLALDSIQRETLREKGLLQASKFSWKRAAAATLKVYERAVLLSGRHAPEPFVTPPHRSKDTASKSQ